MFVCSYSQTDAWFTSIVVYRRLAATLARGAESLYLLSFFLSILLWSSFIFRPCKPSVLHVGVWVCLILVLPIRCSRWRLRRSNGAVGRIGELLIRIISPVQLIRPCQQRILSDVLEMFNCAFRASVTMLSLSSNTANRKLVVEGRSLKNNEV